MEIVLYGDPRTKKNSLRVYKGRVLPSKAYEQYREDCLWQLRNFKEYGERVEKPIDYPITVRCVYYMETRRSVDLSNLLQASLDILRDAGIILDDNKKIVATLVGMDGGQDKENPRAVITITPKED